MLMPATQPLDALESAGEFQSRHIGPSPDDEEHMLSVIGAQLPNFTRRALIEAVVPRSIARGQPMALPAPAGEALALAELRTVAAKNRVLKSFIGQGYHGTLTPGVIQRNILENPAWYTAYTPYQAEISQGRMEALVNFQTMVCDLTGMAIANASMLDEATAAAEAMTLAKRSVKAKSETLIVADDCHPQTIEVVRTRAAPLGLKVVVGSAPKLMQEHEYFAVLAQYPSSDGMVHDLKPYVDQAHAKGAAFIVAADLLALTLLVPPGEFDADIVVGNSQRFGVPMGAGGPHAAYLACRDAFKRSMPGRLVGVSIDADGAPAYRLALQTREQHIRREKATSNICTAQVLLAVIASMYAVYHGPQGLQRIARRVASYTAILAQGLKAMGLKLTNPYAFDTLTVETGARSDTIAGRAVAAGANLRRISPDATRHRARRDDDPRRHRRGMGLVRTRRRQVAVTRRSCQGNRAADTAGAAPNHGLPHAPGVQHPSQRNRDAALHPPALGQGSGAGPLDDPARLVHDEVERHQRDDPDHVARIRRDPPVRAGRSACGLCAAQRAVVRLVGAGHGLCRHQPAAQCRLAGRVRRAARDPRLARLAQSGPPQRVPDSRVGAWHQPGQCAHGRHERGRGQVQ